MPKTKLSFGLLGMASPQALTPETHNNPFATTSNGNREADSRIKPQEDDSEGWTFQGRRRHIPKIAMLQKEPQQPPPDTPQQETTPGGKRGQTHSEVPPSYFPYLGIQVPPNRELFRARRWSVLVREKNSRKETLVQSKNQARPSLPLNIRITGSVVSSPRIFWNTFGNIMA
ncbi:unnamed protein product [Sphagnum balticum]